jgi:hypothetical protein
VKTQHVAINERITVVGAVRENWIIEILETKKPWPADNALARPGTNAA